MAQIERREIVRATWFGLPLADIVAVAKEMAGDNWEQVAVHLTRDGNDWTVLQLEYASADQQIALADPPGTVKWIR